MWLQPLLVPFPVKIVLDWRNNKLHQMDQACHCEARLILLAAMLVSLAGVVVSPQLHSITLTGI
jgi:hypothetical protein